MFSFEALNIDFDSWFHFTRTECFTQNLHFQSSNIQINSLSYHLNTFVSDKFDDDLAHTHALGKLQFINILKRYQTIRYNENKIMRISFQLKSGLAIQEYCES